MDAVCVAVSANITRARSWPLLDIPALPSNKRQVSVQWVEYKPDFYAFVTPSPSVTRYST
jgi:hypothetical protein